MYPAGAIVQILAVGELAPPLLLHTSAVGNTGAVSFAQRLSANQLRMTWQLQAYVQQSSASLTLPTTADTLLWDYKMKAMNTSDPSDYPTLSFGNQGSNYQSTCDTWVNSASALVGGNTFSLSNVATVPTPDAAGNSMTSGYSCNGDSVTNGGTCHPMQQSQLPADLLSGLTSSAISNASYWVQYAMTITCTITANGTNAPTAVTQPFTIPATTISIPYRLANGVGSSNTEFTDDVVPPFSSVMQVAYTAPGEIDTSISFNLTSKISLLNESTIANSQTLTDMVYSTENNTDLTLNNLPIAYSQVRGHAVPFDPLQGTCCPL